MGLIRVRSTRMYKCVLLTIFLILLKSYALADWEEPVEVVKGQWGEANNEFGFRKAQYMYGHPRSFVKLSNGHIVINDYINKKEKFFNEDGTFIKSIAKFSFGMYAFEDEKVLAFDRKSGIFGLFDLKAEVWLWQDESNQIPVIDQGLEYFVAEDNSKITVLLDKLTGTGIEYSSDGVVLSKFTDRPLFFGKVLKNSNTIDGKANQLIAFEDATYNCVVPDGFDSFRRDNDGYLYGIAYNVGKPAHTRIYKMTKCGKIIGTLDYPTAKGTYINPYPGVPLKEAYGEPVFAQNGDVYTWKRSPEAYSILKWTWVDDPNIKEGPDMPEEVQALPSTSGVYLTWNPSPQDPGCVTGYDIERATSATGVFSNVTTVPLDEEQTYSFNDTGATAGATWYYRIMATSAIGNSDPVEVSAARP